MPNPLFNSIFNNAPQMNTLKNIIGAFKSGGNPMALFNALGGSNVESQQIMNQLRQGADPKSLFYNLCKTKGINPESVLSQLR